MSRMKKLLFLLFFVAAGTNAQAQTTIQGVLKDTLDIKAVPFASVSVIDQKDSSLVAFTRSAANGKFAVPNVAPGNYLLLIVQAKYSDYLDRIEISENVKTKNLGTIELTQIGQLLKEVTITAKNAVVMKGDTLEYLADSFNVRQGAVVEDLLKVLPGLQVDKEGNITSMGQKVQKVLVNGEEFFGNDPTVATQNIQAKVVEKVQVFDKKSEQAAFTGFDDGEEEKTINLQLKKNMNKGFFGKVEAGGGWEDRWNNQAMINWFEGKRQISAYGFMNSNGQAGLSWQDRRQFGSGSNMRMFGGNGDDAQIISSFFEDDDDDQQIGGFGVGNMKPGINKSWTGGARYANKLDDDKHQVSANYSQGRLNRELEKRDYTETILPNGSILRDDTATSFSTKNTHNLDARYKWEIDSTFTAVYKLDGQLRFNESRSKITTLNKSNNEVPLSRNTRDNTTDAQTTRVTNSLTLNKKLKKKGRTLSFFGSHTLNKKEGEGFLLSLNELGIGSTGISTNYDQRRLDNSQANSILGAITYTEPIAKNVLMKLGYGVSYDNANLSTLTQDTLGFGEGNYLNQIDSLSNEFDMTILRNSGSVDLMYNKGKVNLTVGSALAFSSFDQYDNIRDINYDYNRINVFPNLKFRYKFSQFKRIDINYSGGTTNPTAQQLQPNQNNTNPLEVYVGNPDLKIGYQQNIRVNFFTFQALEGRGMWAGAMIQNAFNPVSIDRNFDPSGRTVNRYVNLSNNFISSAWFGFMNRFGTKGWETRTNVSGSFSDMPTIINGVESRTKNYSVNIVPNITYNNEEKMSLTIDPGFTYNFSQNQVNRDRNISYWSFNPTASVAVYLPGSVEIGTDLDYEFRPAVNPYPNDFSRFLLDAHVSKRFLTSKNLELSFGMWDILNQNQGYTRATTNNYNTESFYNILQRYWMLSATWNFFSGPLAESRASTGKGHRYGNKKSGRRN